MMDFGYKTAEAQLQGQVTSKQLPERRAESTTASSSRPRTTSCATIKKSIDKRRELTRRHSGASESHNRDLGDSFEDAADGGDEFIRDGDMRQNKMENKAAAPAPWWENAWSHIERKMDSNADEVTNRMNRLFTLQSQRMDNIEQRLEAEPKRTADMLKAVDINIHYQQQDKANETTKLDVNLTGIEEIIISLGAGKP